jgi:hypothetical protein
MSDGSAPVRQQEQHLHHHGLRHRLALGEPPEASDFTETLDQRHAPPTSEDSFVTHQHNLLHTSAAPPSQLTPHLTDSPSSTPRFVRRFSSSPPPTQAPFQAPSSLTPPSPEHYHHRDSSKDHRHLPSADSPRHQTSGSSTPTGHRNKSIRPFILAIMAFEKGRKFSTGTSVHRKRQMSTLVEKEGHFGPALTVRGDGLLCSSVSAPLHSAFTQALGEAAVWPALLHCLR